MNVLDYDVFSLGIREDLHSVDYGTTKQKNYATLSEALKQ